jgi:U4/U6 small nuclear ribonucleoprotein PRP4
VAFHPSGDYVASASFDTTWRLWDVNTSKELMLQEGHSKEVFTVEFQDDGALIVSGFVSVLKFPTHLVLKYFSGLDAIGRVWDLRTGRTAMILDGHVQAIYSIAFSPNGSVALPCVLSVCLSFIRYQVATGAGDDTIRLWDIRSLKALYTIPAHLSNVSDIRFFRANDLFYKPLKVDEDADMNGTDEDSKQRDSSESESKEDVDITAKGYTQEEWRYRSGLFFASAGYDGLLKLWSADDWQLLRTLTTDAGKVMSVDISSDGGMVASGTYNRNFQLYTPED